MTANLTAEQKANATVQVTIELDESGLIKVGKAVLVLREEDDEGASAKTGMTDKLKGLFNKFGSNNKDSTSSSSSSAPDAEPTGDASKDDGESNPALTDEEQAELDELIKKSLLPPAKTKLSVDVVQPIEGGAMSTEEKSQVKKRSVFALSPFALRAHAQPGSPVRTYRLRDAKTSLQRKLAREEARNALEAYVYRVRDLLDQSTFVSSSVENERKAIRELNDKTGDWLWDEGESAKTTELKDKKRELE